MNKPSGKRSSLESSHRKRKDSLDRDGNGNHKKSKQNEHERNLMKSNLTKQIHSQNPTTQSTNQSPDLEHNDSNAHSLSSYCKIHGFINNAPFEGSIRDSKPLDFDFASQSIFDITFTINGEEIKGKFFSDDFEAIKKSLEPMQFVQNEGYAENKLNQDHGKDKTQMDKDEKSSVTYPAYYHRPPHYYDPQFNAWMAYPTMDTTQNQYSWEYHDPSQSTNKSQSNKWTNITFSGDTRIVNRSRFSERNNDLENEYQTMVIQTFEQDKNQEDKIDEKTSDEENCESET